MPSLYAEITIDAPRAIVWQTLIRKENWLRWNTFLFDCNPDQPFQEGQTVLLSVRRMVGDDEIEFQPQVTLLQPTVCLQWVSTAPGFQNRHNFELQDVGVNRTKYRHQEHFSGVLTPVLLRFIRQDEQQGLRRMASELKRYVEYLSDRKAQRR